MRWARWPSPLRRKHRPVASVSSSGRWPTLPTKRLCWANMTLRREQRNVEARMHERARHPRGAEPARGRGTSTTEIPIALSYRTRGDRSAEAGPIHSDAPTAADATARGRAGRSAPAPVHRRSAGRSGSSDPAYAQIAAAIDQVFDMLRGLSVCLCRRTGERAVGARPLRDRRSPDGFGRSARQSDGIVHGGRLAHRDGDDARTRVRERGYSDRDLDEPRQRRRRRVQTRATYALSAAEQRSCGRPCARKRNPVQERQQRLSGPSSPGVPRGHCASRNRTRFQIPRPNRARIPASACPDPARNPPEEIAFAALRQAFREVLRRARRELAAAPSPTSVATVAICSGRVDRRPCGNGLGPYNRPANRNSSSADAGTTSTS